MTRLSNSVSIQIRSPIRSAIRNGWDFPVASVDPRHFAAVGNDLGPEIRGTSINTTAGSRAI